ncbi:hypothetical protein SAMN05216326_1275 [Nitrosomonas marina]|uniref:Uncharacterized protein n=1 Tax=Nitrosomonas marina TaxID=917 RepID=A0A1I0EG32_9PROT|nr:hypothetical protein [Nitrosomonas marina]SET43812.1 hypothetical protein SAMN05216326_1275 [Nitrosomonas marina]
MLNIKPLRLRRMTLQMRELTIGESIAIASSPPHLEEALCTTFLNSTKAGVQSTIEGMDNPQNWTVQERIMAVCHYLSVTSDTGPDFQLEGGAHLTDYLDASKDAALQDESISLGELHQDKWHIRHLTGAMAESIERLVGQIDGIDGRLHWILGGMACQLVREGESMPDPVQKQNDFDAFILEKIKIISAYPESEFEQLMFMYMEGRNDLHHLFITNFSNEGIVALPVPKEGEGVAESMSPARFPVRQCISRIAHDLARKPIEHSVQSEPVRKYTND